MLSATPAVQELRRPRTGHLPAPLGAALASVRAGLVLAAHNPPPTAARPECIRHHVTATLTSILGASRYRLTGRAPPAGEPAPVRLLVPSSAYSHRHWTGPGLRTDDTLRRRPLWTRPPHRPHQRQRRDRLRRSAPLAFTAIADWLHQYSAPVRPLASSCR